MHTGLAFLTSALMGAAALCPSAAPAQGRAADAPEHLRYMGGRCLSLNEALRTAYQRGTPADVVAALRKEYQRDCRDEEAEALMRLSKERREAQRQHYEEARQIQVAQQAAQERDARKAQQCAESRRILAAKKARTDLTPGEINDLRRFEDNIAERCRR